MGRYEHQIETFSGLYECDIMYCFIFTARHLFPRKDAISYNKGSYEGLGSRKHYPGRD